MDFQGIVFLELVTRCAIQAWLRAWRNGWSASHLFDTINRITFATLCQQRHRTFGLCIEVFHIRLPRSYIE